MTHLQKFGILRVYLRDIGAINKNKFPFKSNLLENANALKIGQ